MRDGSWTIEPCEYADVKALADELELGEVTASILVRRGNTDVEEARRFVRGEIEPHDPFLLGDIALRWRAGWAPPSPTAPASASA